jgi:hypothetical protein
MDDHLSILHCIQSPGNLQILQNEMKLYKIKLLVFGSMEEDSFDISH